MKKSAIQIVLGSALLIAFDVVSKVVAEIFFSEPLVVINGFFRLFVSYNPGIAFSIPIPNVVMIAVVPIVAVTIMWHLSRTCNIQNPITKVSFMLIVAGAVGNLIDRIVRGYVVDFIDFSFWPSFNFADSYITIGVFLILIFYGRIIKNG